MPKIAHIINPVKVKETSDLFVAQPISFKTMQIAQQIARGHGIEVELYSAQFSEDREIVPDEFLKTPDLERSVLDVGTFQIARKLPLIQDILDRLYKATDADYLIYTNVDIALMPHFYLTVDRLIEQGYDAFVINRRTISQINQTLETIPLMYAETGKQHGGHDCFVFPKNHYSNYHLKNLCIGASLIGRGLLANLICNAQNFQEFKDFHLTFHLGDDRSWTDDRLEDYTIHNLKEANLIIEEYKKEEKLKEHPAIATFLKNSDNANYWLGKIPQKTNLISRIVSLIKIQQSKICRLVDK